MVLDKELVNFIKDIISNYYEDENEKAKIFSHCYISVVNSLKNSSNIYNIWGYIRTIVMSCIKDYVSQTYLERKDN